jgi:hypothetical protein
MQFKTFQRFKSFKMLKPPFPGKGRGTPSPLGGEGEDKELL